VDLQPPSNVNIVSNFKFSQDWELLDSITPPFECFSNGVLKDPVPKKPSLPKWLAKKVSMYQCFEAGHNIVSHRLSLLFPKLRLSNFMISSLASAIFVQCPPKKMCTIEPPRPCRATAAIQAVGPIMPCLLLLAGWPVTRPACWSESLYNYSHAYTVPERAHRPPAMSLKQINYYLSIIIFFSSLTSLNWKNTTTKIMFKFILYIKNYYHLVIKKI
jgi:hypothetical protein